MANEYGNYSIINPLHKLNSIHTISGGNLTVVSGSASSGYGYTSSIGLPSSGVWEAEVTLTVQGGTGAFGIITDDYDQSAVGDVWGTTTGNVVSLTNGGTIGVDGSNVQTGLTSWSAGDKVICQADVDNGTIKFFLNTGSGYSQLGSTVTGRSSATMTGQVFWSASKSSTHTHDFGQNGFTLQGSSSKYLSTANLPTPAVPNYEDEYFIKAGISHSNGSTTAVTLPKNVSGGAMVRIKRTDDAGSWYGFDTVRGVNKSIRWDVTEAESTNTFDDQNLTGTTFTMPSDLASGTYLLECFYVGSYFQIKGFVGDHPTVQTISYGSALDSAPGFMVFFNRDGSTQERTMTYHVSTGNASRLDISDTVAAASSAGAFGSFTPTTTQFKVGNEQNSNQDDANIISYHWANSGPYRFGTYEGNAVVDGTFINIGGFATVMVVKNIDSAASYQAVPRVLQDYNSGANASLQWDNDGVGGTAAFDVLSNGAKMRTANVNFNSAHTFVYLAFGIRLIQGDGGINQGRAK